MTRRDRSFIVIITIQSKKNNVIAYFTIHVSAFIVSISTTTTHSLLKKITLLENIIGLSLLAN
jgi:hypothetical protein